MPLYRATVPNRIGYILLRARTIEGAARNAGVRWYGHPKTLDVRRATGVAGYSGFFQAYIPIGPRDPNAYTSIGESFHVGPDAP